MNNTVKEYLDKVGAAMDYPKRTKKYFLKELGKLIENYIAEHPDATVHDLENEFGKPEEYKDSLADKSTYCEMLKKAEKKSRIFLILCIILGIVAVLAIIAVVLLIKEYGSTVTISNIKIISEEQK